MVKIDKGNMLARDVENRSHVKNTDSSFVDFTLWIWIMKLKKVEEAEAMHIDLFHLFQFCYKAWL